mgnify:CR=1 FL=1
MLASEVNSSRQLATAVKVQSVQAMTATECVDVVGCPFLLLLLVLSLTMTVINAPNSLSFCTVHWIVKRFFN